MSAPTADRTASLAARISRAPIPFDPAWAEELRAALDPALTGGAVGDLVIGAGATAPYLGRLARAEPEWLAAAIEAPPEETLDATLREMAAAVAAASGKAEAAAALRRAKARSALLIALADLGGVWELGDVVSGLTRLADTAVSASVDWLIGEARSRGTLPEGQGGPGYVVLALGKHGAGELNFSSDIDLICLFDQDRFARADLADAKSAFIKITRGLVTLLADRMEDGYVFRTDLRLRPNPSSTPVCLAMEPAERYYESLGRTWERAAHIKARPIAGDIAAGRAYLGRLTPFVWRRHLDFAAIEDTYGMLRKIREKKGKFTPEGLPGHDIKLGPGGIREIEFFAQTRQLISGGRDPRLRMPTTLGALEALVGGGWTERETADRLARDYVAHRDLEHRLQMIEDAQTQTIPLSAEARARVAALDGASDLGPWEAAIAARLADVHAASEAFFAPQADQGEAPVEIDAEYLAERGFARPEDALKLLERWRGGRIPATRSARALELYTRLEPRIVRKLARSGSPDEAIAELDRFMSGLPAGVQMFSLFKANPHLLELIVEIVAVAPRLASHLGRRPQVIDALLSQEFFQPLPDTAELASDLEAWLAREDDYERILDAARRWAREQHFRAGVQVLRGLAAPQEAGAAFSAIAEACLGALLPRVIAEFSSRHGPPPGNGLAVIALGKLGSREMTAGSDLDLIIVYDPGEATESDGPRPLAPRTYYPRLTQALVAALTAPTAEGRLYEVDMRLRPSGRQGPVATSLSGFEGYQREHAWVWEHLALTRARVICGAEALRSRIEAIIGDVLATRAGNASVIDEACEMRAKLAEAHGTERTQRWALKHAAGGLMEIEFLAQTGALACGLDTPIAARDALPALAEAGWLSDDDADALGAALALMQGLQHLERAALDTPFDPETAGQGLRKAVARAGGVGTFAELESLLDTHQRRAAEICREVLACGARDMSRAAAGKAGKG